MASLPDTALVVFGLTGDLARRKLLPAIFHLERERLLPQTFRLVGVSRQGTSAREVRDRMRPEKPDEADLSALERLGPMVSVVGMDILQADQYERLAAELDRLDREAGHPLNRLFYLAIPAQLFEPVITRLSEPDIGRCGEGARACRFLIEKPFGHDLQSAKKLVRMASRRIGEPRVYRIDHYLAKETAQNILAFRFENPLFDRAWDRRHISHILVTASESIGIEGRAAFYEGMGALRDIFQSHLLQLLALATMERPERMDERHIHREKERLLARVRAPAARWMEERAIRAQYRGYRAEAGNPDSMVETYAALWLTIDSERWRGVPVLLRTGKALREKVTEITVVFSDRGVAGRANALTLRIQPDEGIAIDLRIKRPGLASESGDLDDVQLDYCYRGTATRADAYERVLVDAIRGDRTLFASQAEVLSCWRVAEPILRAWASPDFPLHEYEGGAPGPEAADEMAARAGFPWFDETHSVCSR